MKSSAAVVAIPEPLVKFADGYFEFYSDGEMVYDIKPADAADCLRWMEHLTQKTWVTAGHMEQFSRLAAKHLCGLGG